MREEGLVTSCNLSARFVRKQVSGHIVLHTQKLLENQFMDKAHNSLYNLLCKLHKISTYCILGCLVHHL